MCSIQIKVTAEHKAPLLEALDELRKTKSLEFQIDVIDEESKLDRESEENCTRRKENCPQSEPVSSNNPVAVDSSDSEENEITPKEIASDLNRWLDRKGVARVDFARYINRSKSHFTEMLSRPPSSLPKGVGSEAWIKMRNFMKDKSAQSIFLEKTAKKRSHPAKSTKPETEKKQKRAKFERWQSVMLDEIFVKCDGRLEKETLQRICPTIKLEQRQVNIIFTIA